MTNVIYVPVESNVQVNYDNVIQLIKMTEVGHVQTGHVGHTLDNSNGNCICVLVFHTTS